MIRKIISLVWNKIKRKYYEIKMYLGFIRHSNQIAEHLFEQMTQVEQEESQKTKEVENGMGNSRS